MLKVINIRNPDNIFETIRRNIANKYNHYVGLEFFEYRNIDHGLTFTKNIVNNVLIDYCHYLKCKPMSHFVIPASITD